MGKNRQQYIHNLARNIMGQFSIRPEQFLDYSDAKTIARQLDDLYAEKLRDGSKRLHWTSSFLGEVACCGRGSLATDGVTLWNVCYDKDRFTLPLIHNGEYLVREIAIITIIAAMADNIWADLKRHREVNSENSGALGNPSF